MSTRCRNGLHRKEGPGECVECRLASRRAAQVRYQQTEKGKAARSRFAQSPKGKASLKARRQREAEVKARIREAEAEMKVRVVRLGNGHLHEVWTDHLGRTHTYTAQIRRNVHRHAKSSSASPVPPPSIGEFIREKGWAFEVCDGEKWVECEKGWIVGRGEWSFIARTADPAAASTLLEVEGSHPLTSRGEFVFVIPVGQLERVADALGVRSSIQQKEVA